jgi:hypothetical protein
MKAKFTRSDSTAKRFTKSKQLSFKLLVKKITLKRNVFRLRPPSYSDNLAQLISKIDFSEFDDKKQNQAEKKKPQNGDDLKTEAITARKFYQSIHEKVR